MTRSAALLGALIAGLFGNAAGLAHADAALQPYQMVRSLQLVQDRIADGDHAAVPMQKKLLEMIDARLLDASGDEIADERNLRAVLVYAMSGGNPRTVEATLRKLKLDGADKALSLGVVSYLRGNPAAAQAALASTNPVALPAELGAFVALIKGSVAADADPAAAVVLLDQARLLGPGTLVEEAALRRSVSLAATLADGARFLRLSSLYARRYLRSPYASQFADALVAGVVALAPKLALDKVDEITSWMTGEQRQVLYLRIARRAAIDGLTQLADFASAKARQGGGEQDARALLYSMLGTIASETMEDAELKLARIDRSALSRSDLDLLDAVTAVAGGLTATPPDTGAAIEASTYLESPPAAASPRSAGTAADENEPARNPLPAPASAETASPEPAGHRIRTTSDAGAAPETVAQADAGGGGITVAPGARTASADAAGPRNAEAAAPYATEEIVKIARTKLEEVDRLLGETAQ